MATIYDVLGNNIRNLRKTLKWSQAQLAEKVDVSVPYITMIELGQRSASLEVIQSIALAFSVPVSSLFEDFEKERNVYEFKEHEKNMLDGVLIAEQGGNYALNILEKKLEKSIKALIHDAIDDLKKTLQ